SAVARTRGIAEIVIDTTGNPAAFELALELAIREVHVKSTHGRPAIGLRQPTAFVVDELSLVPLGDFDPGAATFPSPPLRLAALPAAVPGGVAAAAGAGGLTVGTGEPRELAARLAGGAGAPFGAADVAVVSTLEEIDAAIRVDEGSASGLVRPRGMIAVVDI